MTRILKVLSVMGLSSVYLMQGACQMGPDGYSIIPTVPSFAALLAQFGITI